MGIHKEQLPQRIRVEVIESERGWGQKVEDVLYFDTQSEAEKWVKEYNSKNDSIDVPDWYMYARIA